LLRENRVYVFKLTLIPNKIRKGNTPLQIT